MKYDWHSQGVALAYKKAILDPDLNWYERQVNMPSLLKLIPKNTNILLDYGCGPGNFTVEFTSRAKSVIGSDASAEMIKLAKKYYPNLDWLVWDAQSTKLPINQKFDGVVSKLTFHHIDSLKDLAVNLQACITPNGFLVFSVPHPIKSLKHVEAYYGDSTYKDSLGDMDLMFEMFHRSVGEYLEPFLKAGFVVDALEEPTINNRLARQYMKVAGSPMRMNVRLRL